MIDSQGLFFLYCVCMCVQNPKYKTISIQGIKSFESALFPVSLNQILSNMYEYAFKNINFFFLFENKKRASHIVSVNITTKIHIQ